jgi:hypothetical protein
VGGIGLLAPELIFNRSERCDGGDGYAASMLRYVDDGASALSENLMDVVKGNMPPAHVCLRLRPSKCLVEAAEKKRGRLPELSEHAVS